MTKYLALFPPDQKYEIIFRRIMYGTKLKDNYRDVL